MTTQEPHSNHGSHTSSDVDCTSGNGNAMTCLHLGCCEWRPAMSMCVAAPEPSSNADAQNRCPEALDQHNCEHFAHAHSCQGVSYTCVWDSAAGTCDRENEC